MRSSFQHTYLVNVAADFTSVVLSERLVRATMDVKSDAPFTNLFCASA